MIAIRRRIRFLAVVTFPFVSACYTYAPVRTPEPGSQVRAGLTVEGAVRQSDILGRPVRNLNGRLVSMDADEVALDVIVASTRGQLQEIVLRDTLRIPMEHLEGLQQRVRA